MNNESIELFEPVPTLRGRQRIWVYALSLLLSYGFLIIVALVWWQSNWYIALSSLLLAYIVMGIVSSKLLHFYVPHKQHEFHYSNRDLAAWIVSYYA